MKVVVVLMSLVALGLTGPPPKVLENFQDHFEQFMVISDALEGDHWRRQSGAYARFVEYPKSLNALAAKDFKQIVADLGSEAEVIAIREFLENLTIDVDYYVDHFQDVIKKLHANDFSNITAIDPPRRVRRHPMTGTTMRTYIADTISLLPIRQLRQLFNQRVALNDIFKTAIEGIRSDEFKVLYNALWQNEKFQDVAASLADADFDLKYVFEEFLPSLFGQNDPIRITFQMQFDYFLQIVIDMESGHWLRQVTAYKDFPEFKQSLGVLANTSLGDFYQSLMRTVPAFTKLDAFLKKNDIFVAYLIGRVDLLSRYYNKYDHAISCNEIVHPRRQRRHPMTGRTMHTFLADTVSLLPIRQLRVLYEEKVANEEDFKNTINALKSDEFKELYKAMWEADGFLKVADELKTKSDFDLKYVLEELVPAMYGQNTPLYTSFQTQFDEFLEIIIAKAGESFKRLVESYKQFPEFKSSLDTVDNTVFMQFYQDLRKVDIFKSYDEYMKKNDIYVAYYIDRFEYLSYILNTNVTQVGTIKIKETADITPSGRTMNDFLSDVVDILPKTELAALFSDKMEQNKVFKNAVESLTNEEGQKFYNDFWANRVFQAVANALANNNFDLRYVFETLVPALYGQ
ncbi:unnamed protein product [Leptosia nina]|uniref:Uncharacterized protein n=1 Tax=Leptosia nina TaxID=320188 RepID=A0AAV1IZC5_9NEOP